jgi:hypothetical protein
MIVKLETIFDGDSELSVEDPAAAALAERPVGGIVISADNLHN